METSPMDHVDLKENNLTKKKIFIPAIGTLGDVKPYLILAKELKQQNNIVWMGVHQQYQQYVESNQIATTEIGGDMALVLSTTSDGIEIQRNPSVFKINLVKRVFVGLMEQWFNGIVSGIKDADLIVLSATSVLAGLSAIEKFPKLKAVGIYAFPCIQTCEFTPPALGGSSNSLFKWINTFKWKLFARGASSIYTEIINQCRSKIGLPAIKLDYNQMIRSVLKKPMLTATIYSPTLLARPQDWLETDLMVGPIISDSDHDFQPSNELKDFLEKSKDDKLIYIGFGSMMGLMFSAQEQKRFLRYIQTAVQQNNCKSIISIVGFQDLDGLDIINSDKIFFIKENIPHSWLFLQISLAVHHGGAGTSHASLLAGLPTLIIPFGADQVFNGDRIFINRLGPKPIPARQVNERNLNEAIRNLITNLLVYQEQTKRIAESIRKENGLETCLAMIDKELKS